MVATPTPNTQPILYPDRDGKPMSDNTKQARWIFVFYGNLSALYRDRDDVFVAADNLWYPVEGEPTIRNAPDVYVAFGRPKGDRGSYKQWEEDNVPLTVVFEILSPGNTAEEMREKLYFYDEHGVEEYYVYDPDRDELEVYVRGTMTLVRKHPADGHKSPRMGIRFDLSGEEMVVFSPDGRMFRTFEELADVAARDAERAEKAEEKLVQTEEKLEQAEERAGKAEERADKAEEQLEKNRLAMIRIRELGRKARRGLASAEELAELERLEEEPS